MEDISRRKRTDEPDVEAHKLKQHAHEEPAVSPEEKADDDSDTPDVEAHRVKQR